MLEVLEPGSNVDWFSIYSRENLLLFHRIPLFGAEEDGPEECYSQDVFWGPPSVETVASLVANDKIGISCDLF